MGTDSGGIARILGNRREFISRLRFEDTSANVCYFSSPYSEQVSLIEALEDRSVRTVVVLKPRQIGISTANCADTFYETFTSRKPLRTLIVTDHNKTTRSLFGKFCSFYNYLPELLQCANRFRVNRNDKTLISDTTGALIDHLTARGDTHGRGWTYQRLIAEEMAFWAHPEEVWSGLRSTLHEGPDMKMVIISTPNGPGDFYHERVMGAIEAERSGDRSIRFIFSRWADHAKYRKSAPRGWEPTEEEHQLGLLHDLDRSQLYWRHEMVYGVEGIGERRFRREYPLTVEDGFLVLEGCWFDVDYLNDLLVELPRALEGELRVYVRPRADTEYVIGVDPSWCTGGDYAVACVMSDLGEQVAVLSVKEGGEELFSEKVIDLSIFYGKARVLCEANTGGAGRNVIRVLVRNGVPVWKGDRGQDWVTMRGNKEEAYAFCRQLVNSDALWLRDHGTIQELMHIREKNNKIEGQDGYHDDHADALVLACWALRRCDSFMGRSSERRRRVRRVHPLSRIAGVINGS